MKNRLEEIKKKGFNIVMDRTLTDFNKIKVGAKTLEDAVINLGELKKLNPNLANKDNILNAINNNDLKSMREISNFFYRTSGIYSRLCKYMAYMYKYDWMVTPYIDNEKVNDDDSKQINKILSTFNKILLCLDNFGVKKFFGETALKVLKEGCYYGYVIYDNNGVNIQDLPVNYCRSRFNINGRPAVEFNMKFFDDYYKDTEQRIRVLNLFPKEFSKGYIAYKQGKLKPDFAGDAPGWYVLDPKFSIKFNINGDDYPAFISIIPAIIDLDAAQDLDRKKMAQKLLKIIIQKMPLDKNGDLIFDIDEAQALHNNAVKMLSKAIGLDVLTTFADVEVADMADKNTTNSVDELMKVERTVYNEAGVSQMQFNTDGNLALEKSILNDEAAMYHLVQQFEDFLNHLIEPFNNYKKTYFRVQILNTTIYNYKEISKIYKEQTQIGYSKMLPQIALGQSQSSILANAYFENNILDLVNVFIPPIMSSTMNADTIETMKNKGGRPTKESQGESVSEKTIQNKESQT